MCLDLALLQLEHQGKQTLSMLHTRHQGSKGNNVHARTGKVWKAMVWKKFQWAPLCRTEGKNRWKEHSIASHSKQKVIIVGARAHVSVWACWRLCIASHIWKSIFCCNAFCAMINSVKQRFNLLFCAVIIFYCRHLQQCHVQYTISLNHKVPQAIYPNPKTTVLVDWESKIDYLSINPTGETLSPIDSNKISWNVFRVSLWWKGDCFHLGS